MSALLCPPVDEPGDAVGKDKSKKKVRTWGPSSVHQKERDKVPRVEVQRRFLAERSNSVPNLGMRIQDEGTRARMSYAMHPLAVLLAVAHV